MTKTTIDRERISDLVAELTRAGDVRRLRDIRDQLASAAARRGHARRMTRADRAALTDPASLMARITRGYRRRPHLDVIGRAIAGLAARDYDRLLINEPPQTGKTVTAVVGAAFWWLAKNPTHRIVIGSYGDALAIDRGTDIKRLVEEHGHRYGLEMARGSTRKQDWRLVTGGGVKSVGVGTGIAGYPADIAFIDDPHKSRQEADSVVSRERVWRWFSADITSRLAPRAPVIVVMTLWHEDDLAARLVAEQGRIEDGGRWRVLRMPALCDDPIRDPLGRALGEPLPHPLIDQRDVQSLVDHWSGRRATSTTRDWASLYMCDPRPTEGALLQRSLMRERRCYMVGSPCHPCDPRPTRAAVAVDPSGGGHDTAGIVGGYLGTDKRLYITHDASGVMPSDAWARAACEMAVDIDADLIIFEKNFGGDMAGRLIRTAWSSSRAAEREEARQRLIADDPRLSVREIETQIDRLPLRYARICPHIKSVPAKKNKWLRAEPIAQQWIEDRIRTATYLPELEEEWCTWQADSSESPGRIDASVYLAYALLPVPKAGGSTVRRSPSGSLPVSGMGPLG